MFFFFMQLAGFVNGVGNLCLSRYLFGEILDRIDVECSVERNKMFAYLDNVEKEVDNGPNSTEL